MNNISCKVGNLIQNIFKGFLSLNFDLTSSVSVNHQNGLKVNKNDNNIGRNFLNEYKRLCNIWGVTSKRIVYYRYFLTFDMVQA